MLPVCVWEEHPGGKDKFESDGVAAEQVLAQIPGLRRAALENRRFLRRVVRFLVGEAGIDQFLDIGVGLPIVGKVANGTPNIQWGGVGRKTLNP